MKTTLAHRITLTAAALLAAGCQQLGQLNEPKPQPVTPQITEGMLRDRAQEQLAAGVKQYDSGDYENALKSLTGALDHGLLSKADQSRARKYIAFTHCVSNREVQCRDEFRKAFEINPDFSLTAAEDGHPIWGPVYRTVRTQLIAEREAAVRKPLIPLARAEQMLSDGLVKYDAGDYGAAHTLLEGSLREGLRGKEDQVKAMKHVAFSLCLLNQIPQCRAEFIKIYSVDPNFDLTPAEAGHPSWTNTFARAKAQAKKDLAAKSAKEKAPAPPTAGVPKKN
jgi:tetratricopeptide (TPR) repeat protein